MKKRSVMKPRLVMMKTRCTMTIFTMGAVSVALRDDDDRDGVGPHADVTTGAVDRAPYGARSA